MTVIRFPRNIRRCLQTVVALLEEGSSCQLAQTALNLLHKVGWVFKESCHRNLRSASVSSIRSILDVRRVHLVGPRQHQGIVVALVDVHLP